MVDEEEIFDKGDFDGVVYDVAALEKLRSISLHSAGAKWSFRAWLNNRGQSAGGSKLAEGQGAAAGVLEIVGLRNGLLRGWCRTGCCRRCTSCHLTVRRPA